jgi:preprotein translocase subunit YajC
VGNSPLSTFVLLILLVGVFYFLLIRPQRKRQQEQVQMQNTLAPGARIMTTTGLFATVARIEDDDVILEVAPGVETRWLKAAIGRVVTPVEGTSDAEADRPVTDTTDTANGDDSSSKQS